MCGWSSDGSRSRRESVSVRVFGMDGRLEKEKHSERTMVNLIELR
jgi:hypothetical protein